MSTRDRTCEICKRFKLRSDQPLWQTTCNGCFWEQQRAEGHFRQEPLRWDLIAAKCQGPCGKYILRDRGDAIPEFCSKCQPASLD